MAVAPLTTPVAVLLIKPQMGICTDRFVVRGVPFHRAVVVPVTADAGETGITSADVAVKFGLRLGCQLAVGFGLLFGLPFLPRSC